MQNLFVYHLVSGHAWFSCGLLFLLFLTLDLRGTFAPRKRLARAARLILFAALAVAVASATPLPLWLAVPLLACCLTYICFGFASMSRLRRLACGAVTGIAILAVLAFELPYHLTRPPQVERPRRLYVLADSLAAGVSGKTMTWPARLGELTSIEVRNLASPGADIRSALRRQIPVLEREGDQAAWVLVVIGGNDMLAGISVDAFEEDLDHLLAAARGDPVRPRIVLMQELPLIPWAGPLGLRQRRLAARHGVVLIPKRLLAGVLLDDANVTDGLHLSATGHERMAQALVPWLGLEAEAGP